MVEPTPMQAFHKAPDPDRILLLDQFDEALARLEYGVREKEITLLTGDIGTGKTTLTRALIDRLDDEVQFCWIINPRLSASQFLRQIALQLDLEPARGKVDLLDQLANAFLDASSAGRPVSLLIDEAQMMPPDTLEELRLLTNIQLDAENLISVTLVGQPELLRRLRQPRFLPLLQRVGVRYHLSPLTEDETTAYIRTRLQNAGYPPEMFDEQARSAVYAYSHGLPRVINNLCGNALLAAMLDGADTVTSDLIDDVAADLGLVLARGEG